MSSPEAHNSPARAESARQVSAHRYFYSRLDIGIQCTDTAPMKSKFSSKLGFVLGALLIAACGDSNGVGGGDVVCASDNSDVGQTIPCPNGDQTLDFCVDTGSGNCYYVVGGQQANCGNCLENGGNIGSCAQDAIALCD